MLQGIMIGQCFWKKQGINTLNLKPFWQRINKLKGKTVSNSIPSLNKENGIYETNEDKAIKVN